jgi:uncharacterized protein involved in exopolysaccharide biosynthesis
MNAPTDNSTNPRLHNSSSSIAPPEMGTGALGNTPAAAAARTAAAMIAQNPPTGAPDIGAMARRLFAHWQVIVVSLIIGALVTGQIVKTRVATFKSETVIFYREGIGKNVTGPTDGPDTLRTLGTKLKETLLAQQTLRKIIDEFHLYSDVIEKSGYADAVDAMRKKTEFKSRSQDTFAISYEGPDKDTAQKVCARMAEVLIAENAKRLQDDNRGTTEFLEIEKRRADEELERVERDISEFLMSHPEFATAKEGLGVETLQAMKKAAAEAKAAARAKGGGFSGGGGRRKDAPQFPGGPSAAAGERAPAVDPVLLSGLKGAGTELVAARKDFDDKSTRLTEEHPDLKASRARLAAAEANMARQQEAVAAAQAAAAENAPRKLGNTGDDPYSDAKPDAGAKPVGGGVAMAPAEKPRGPRVRDPESDNKAVSLEIEWSRLTRSLGHVRNRQADMDVKLYRIEVVSSTAESGYGSTIAVLDPAYKPSAPSNAPNKTVGMIGLGASLAVGLVLSAAWGLFLDDRVFGAGEIEVIVMVPVIGSVPKRTSKLKKTKAKKEKTASAAPASQGGANG